MELSTNPVSGIFIFAHFSAISTVNARKGISRTYLLCSQRDDSPYHWIFTCRYIWHAHGNGPKQLSHQALTTFYAVSLRCLAGKWHFTASLAIGRWSKNKLEIRHLIFMVEIWIVITINIFLEYFRLFVYYFNYYYYYNQKKWPLKCLGIKSCNNYFICIARENFVKTASLLEISF